jgi:hypothetical protein
MLQTWRVFVWSQLPTGMCPIFFPSLCAFVTAELVDDELLVMFDYLNTLCRLLTFLGVPRGKPRENLIFYSGLTLFFIASWALGKWEANRSLQYLYEK